MKPTVEVAVVQMSSVWLKSDKNRAKMVNYVHQVAKDGPVDLIVFPELAEAGYRLPTNLIADNHLWELSG